MSLPTPQSLDAIYRLGGIAGTWRLNWNGTIHALPSGTAINWFDHGHRSVAICGTTVQTMSGSSNGIRREADVQKVCGRCTRIGKLPT